MYSEQMMREEGFDAGPAFRTAMYTDAIWRACRIILDVRMHRGELTPEEATDFLVEHTVVRDGQRPRRGPPLHVHAGLPALLPAGQGADPRACARTSGGGAARSSASRRSTTRCCATARCRSASTAASCRARAEGAMDVIPAIDVRGGRSRVVYWPGRRRPAPARPPTDRTGSRSSSWRRARGSCTSWTSTARSRRAPVEPRGRGRRGREGGRAAPGCRAGSRRPTTSASPSRPARPGSCCPSPIAERPDALRECLAVAGDWLAVGLDPRPERMAAFPWRRTTPPTLDTLVEELVAGGVRRLVLSHGGASPGHRAPRRAPAAATTWTSSSPAGSPISTASAGCATPA